MISVSKFTESFDTVLAADDVRVVKTPMRAPQANAYAERWVRTSRAECLDWTLIWNRRHLERVLGVYIQHYNAARPHRSIDLNAPIELTPITNPSAPIVRTDLLGGLIREYRRAA